MKKRLLSILMLLGVLYNSQAQKQTEPTLSPYFVVKSKKKGVDMMPLKATSAEVSIAGVIADVVVRQVYVNEGEETLEAIYVFPGSSKSAVYGMTMTIGERKLYAKIEEKKKARQEYENAKKEGKTASLLEQQRPNVFQMNVANILPKDSITVELRYTELLEPENAVYTFVYPTVVGPRYSETPEKDAPSTEKWVKNPYTHEGKLPKYTFDIDVKLNAGLPIQQITSTSHEVNVNYLDKSTGTIELDPKDKHRGNKDFIVKYQLSGGKIESGLLLYEPEAQASLGEDTYEGSDEKFFLLMMQPPKVPNNKQIPPREYVFIVDVSGSMGGFPLNISKKVLRNLIGNLRPTDRFNVMLFESSNQMLSKESMLATQENIDKAIQVIDRQRGGGGTRLLPALQNALNFKQTKDFSRTFVVVTDGYITVEKEAFDLIRSKLDEANLFAFGIGSSVNRYLIEGMAHVGMGEPFIITKPSEADEIADRFRQYIQNPVLTNIKVAYDGFAVYDIDPSAVPDVFAERPIIVYGKYKGSPKGKIKVTGLSGNKTYTKIVDVSNATNQGNQALKYLWARNRIKLLDDYNQLSLGYYNGNKVTRQRMIDAKPENKERIKEVTALGLKYNLLTAYTSFIAVDDKIRNKTGKNTKVKQPLPLPEGVSDKAIPKSQPTYRTAPKSRNYSTKRPPNKKVNTRGSHEAKMYNRVPAVSQPKVVEVPDEVEIEELEDIIDSEMDETVVAPPPPIPPAPLQKEKVPEVFLMAEQQPEFQGGNQAFIKFLRQNIKYPTDAQEAGIEGKVYLQFIVNKDGTVSDIKIMRGVSKSIDAEAIRVLKLSSGKWNAGMQRGKKVNVRMSVPIVFKLSN